ncbi:S8 family serine peptidase [Pseudoalteromonas sp. MMG024]|uniref:S8 family serine peptidase n=1 Tax=Pseudoalteromonas sp. MMG024 TaxID=2909980 RepID=UPI001F001498|nr:S8 family serine peptidase [Pseudoalteromonas sp. MMG024]MCF6456670.1 S8 family serine peptidase [Pseudoalteromonas sp. MMG024]
MTNKPLKLCSLAAVALAVNTAVATEAEGLLTLNLSDRAAVKSPLPKRYIIKYKNNSAFMNFANSTNVQFATSDRLSKMGVNNAQFNASINANIARLSESQLKQLQNDPNVEYIEEDLPRRLMAQTQPYGIAMVQADQVNDSVASAANNGKKICVIDSGLDLPHEDMGTNGGTVTGTNNSGTGNWYQEGGPHGTHVAGTIAAIDNGVGVRGVIGSDPSLHIIKVFNASGWGYSSDLVAAMNECKNAGSDVINMSLGGSGSSTSERNGIQAIADAGLLLIAAAGNDGNPSNTTDIESFPASYDSVMSVAAIDSAKALADFSQKNSQVEIAAPGVDVYSTYPEGTGQVVSLSVGSNAYSVNAMENSGSVTAPLYDFATGESTDSGANGKVCLIQRGNISFHDKVKNCQDSGGVGAVIYNNAAGSFGGTLGDTNQTSIPAVTATDTDGAAMLSQTGLSTTIEIGTGNYGMMSGTSMASPHVAGVAALVWSHHPSCSADDIRGALNATAEDLGAAGRDVKFGHGLVQAKDAIDYLQANGCSGGTTPPNPGENVLVNGQTVSGISANTNEEILYTFEVPAGATDVTVSMSGGSGDADLYTQFNAAPTDSSYECRPYKSGNNETCNLTQSGGTYYVRLKAYSSFSNVSLTASYTEGNDGGTGELTPINDTVNDVSVSRRSWQRYTIDLAAGYTDFNVTMSGGTGDADLYVTHGAQSTTNSYDCRPYESGNNESCSFSTPQAGTWYIDVYGYRAASGITLNVQANP